MTIPERVREAIADQWLSTHDHAETFEEIDEQDRQWRVEHGLQEDGGKPHKEVVISNFLWDAGLEDWLALLAFSAERADVGYWVRIIGGRWEVETETALYLDSVEQPKMDLTEAVIAAIDAVCRHTEDRG